jgi:hypothetical protein
LEEDDEPSRGDKLTFKVRVDGDDALAKELCKEELATAIDEENDHECKYFIVPPAEY